MPIRRNKTYKKRKSLRRKTRNGNQRKNYKRCGGFSNQEFFTNGDTEFNQRIENFRSDLAIIENYLEIAVENHTPINVDNLIQELQSLHAEAIELDAFFGGNQLMNELNQASGRISQLLHIHQVIPEAEPNNNNNNNTVVLGSIRNNNNNNNLSVYENNQKGGLARTCDIYIAKFNELKQRLARLNIGNQNSYDNIGKELTNLAIKAENGGCPNLGKKIGKFIITKYYAKGSNLSLTIYG